MGAMLRGTQRNLGLSQQIPVGTFNSADYWLVEGGGLLITIDVENINGATITDINLQSNHGNNYDTIAPFPAQAINANGRYQYRISPGASRAAGANAYKGAVEDVPPRRGRVQIVNTVAIPTVTIRVEAVGD